MQYSGILSLLLTFSLITGTAGHTALRLRAQPSVKAEAFVQDVTPEQVNATSVPATADAINLVANQDVDDKDDDGADDQDATDVPPPPPAAPKKAITTQAPRHVQAKVVAVTAPAPQAHQEAHEEAQETTEEEDQKTADKLGLGDIENSLAKLGNMKGKATPGMTKFVTITKKMIKDDMKPKIMDAHRKDQQFLNSFKKTFVKCWKGRMTQKATFIALKKTRGSRSTTHKTCRKREATYAKKKDDCDDLLDAQKETMKAACSALSDLTRNPNSEADNCHAARKERFSEWLDRNEKWFMTKNKEYKATARRCGNAKILVKKTKVKCVRQTKLYVGKKAQCDVKQDQLEDATCNLGKKMSQTCHGYLNCYDDNRKAYRRAKPGIKKQEKDRKGEWRVLMRVECLLDVFAKEDGEVDAEVIGKCKNKTHDTTHLDLAYPAIPVKKSCLPLPPVPGQSSFRQAEYSSLPKLADAKIPSICVVEAGAGVALGAPKAVPAAQCSMAGNYLKASSAGSCLLSDVDGKPLKVDYTKNIYTKYSFKMKFSDGNAANWNRVPVGGFKVCNVDRKSYRRGRSNEFNFYDIRGAWGYTFFRHPHTYARYQNRNDRTYGKYGKAYPKPGQDAQWEITMKFNPSSRRLYIHSWKVNGVQLRAYNNYITNCWGHCRHDGCTPRVWAWGATKGVYIRDFRVYQGMSPFDLPQIIGTGVPRTRLTVACAETKKYYSGQSVPGYTRSKEMNVLNCQTKCKFLSGCTKFTYYTSGWCYFYGAGAKKRVSRNAISGPPVCDSPYQTGLKAEFFFYKSSLSRLPNLKYAKARMTRTDLDVWYPQTGHRWASVPVSERFAARWTGSILIKQGGNYRFDITSDDGSFLWIDGRVVVSNPGIHGPRTVYKWARLSPGYHQVMLTQFENRGGAMMYFRYYGPDTDYHHTIVPSEVLRPSNKDMDKTNKGPFGTPDDKQYYKYPDQSKLRRKGSLVYLLATVRAKNDAHIGIWANNINDPVSRSGNFYEIVLGGWSGQRSRVRVNGKDVGGAMVFPYTRNLVTKYEYRDFWISVNEKTGEVEIGKGHLLGKYTFMKYKDSKPMKMKQFAVMSGWGATAEWYFVNKPAFNPKKKVDKFSKGGFFLGKQGEDCTKTCNGLGRVCDEDVRDGFSYAKFRMYIKDEMGATCTKDTRRWWAHDQPCYVAGGPDSNQGKCLAYSNIPTKVRCSGRHSKVMRWCKCSPTKMVFHIKKLNKLQTWDQMAKNAEANGGRLMTLDEARLYIHRRRFGSRYFVRQDVWAAVGDADNKDWIQLGSHPHHPGKSHVEVYRYPNWGNSIARMRGYRNTKFDYLLWVTERSQKSKR